MKKIVLFLMFLVVTNLFSQQNVEEYIKRKVKIFLMDLNFDNMDLDPNLLAYEILNPRGFLNTTPIFDYISIEGDIGSGALFTLGFIRLQLSNFSILPSIYAPMELTHYKDAICCIVTFDENYQLLFEFQKVYNEFSSETDYCITRIMFDQSKQIKIIK